MFSRKAVIKEIFDSHPDAIFITNTGYISRAVYSEYPNNKNIFYMQGSMGLAPCIGLGMALNTHKDIVILSGDASLLMHLGITLTIADQMLNNIWLYVLANGCHESVGGFECSDISNVELKGVDKVFVISNEGKEDRVGLDCKLNTKQIKELF